MYIAHVGCKRWQDDNKVATMKEAREIIEAWSFSHFTQGEDKATEAWIEGVESNQKYEYDIEKGDWK